MLTAVSCNASSSTNAYGYIFSIILYFRLVDLDPDPGPSAGGGQTAAMPQGEEGSRDGEHYNVSRLRSSSIEIREKGGEFLREQLDAAQKVL